MAKRWTPEEDEFLMTWADAVGADFVAVHDLGRPEGAGSRRLNALTKSGAYTAYIKAAMARVEWLCIAGHLSPDGANDQQFDLASVLWKLPKGGGA